MLLSLAVLVLVCALLWFARNVWSLLFFLLSSFVLLFLSRDFELAERYRDSPLST